jgi:hypothetical protein
MGIFKDRSDYFKGLANMNKLVAHDREINGEVRKSFHRINDEEELTAACINWAHFPCIVHTGFSGRYTPQANAVPKRKLSNGLWILDKAVSPMDLNSRADAIDRSFQVMEEVISKMINEYNTTGRCSNFDDIDLGRFSFNLIGPINATLFGLELNWEDDVFADSVTIFDATKWNEE